MTADAVVLAVSGYHVPKVPAMSSRLDASVKQLHSSAYRNPQALPRRRSAGDRQRPVRLPDRRGSASRRPQGASRRRQRAALSARVSGPRSRRVARRSRPVRSAGRSAQAERESTQERQPLSDRARRRPRYRPAQIRDSKACRCTADYRISRTAGLHFADDLAKNLDNADRVYNGICGLIDEHIARNAIEAPVTPHYQPVWQPDDRPHDTRSGRAPASAA